MQQILYVTTQIE